MMGVFMGRQNRLMNRSDHRVGQRGQQFRCGNPSPHQLDHCLVDQLGRVHTKKRRGGNIAHGLIERSLHVVLKRICVLNAGKRIFQFMNGAHGILQITKLLYLIRCGLAPLGRRHIDLHLQSANLSVHPIVKMGHKPLCQRTTIGKAIGIILFDWRPEIAKGAKP